MGLKITRTEEVLATLREHAKRITAPKRAVVEVLVSADDHLTADEVTQRVQQLRPDVSPSTVYRILEELDDLALVVHSHAGQAAAVFHLAGRSHGHVTCENCHVTFARELNSTLGFVLDRHHVVLSGLCAHCQG
jgi:Fur family ferric uptake transcriptional regulator